MAELNIAYFFIYGFALCVMVGFAPLAMAAVWHILRMI